MELPSSPISLHVLSPEESRAASRAISNSSRDDVVAESREDVVLTSRDGNDVLQKSDSGSDVDISHKSFAQRRLHIIRQLETQNGSVSDILETVLKIVAILRGFTISGFQRIRQGCQI